MSELLLPPLSLYIHIPWCERKCPYCDFNSHSAEGALPEDSYIAALLQDLDDDLELAQGRELHSIFIGGGTPSLLSAAAIGQLLEGVRQRLALKTDCEITLEANPGSAEAEKFAGFVEAGINRLSLGVQSFDDAMLGSLGRVHDGAQAVRAIEFALAAGLQSLNIDLMHGLPGQGPVAASADLQRAIDFQPAHLSWYQLTIEQNTAFYSNPPTLPTENDLARIQDSGEAALAYTGYTNYEVSAYARPGYRCHHNLNYWQFGDYLGIGAGAHGKITLPDQDRIRRIAKRRQPASYLARSGGDYRASDHDIPRDERAGDFMLNALRLSDGFDLVQFSARTGVDPDAIASTLDSLAERGLLNIEYERVKASPLGRRYLDSVISEFL